MVDDVIHQPYAWAETAQTVIRRAELCTVVVTVVCEAGTFERDPPCATHLCIVRVLFKDPAEMSAWYWAFPMLPGPDVSPLY